MLCLRAAELAAVCKNAYPAIANWAPLHTESTSILTTDGVWGAAYRRACKHFGGPLQGPHSGRTGAAGKTHRGRTGAAQGPLVKTSILTIHIIKI